MPCCARRVVSVAPIIENAKPEEIPRNKAASGAGSKYGRTPCGRRLRQSSSDRGVIVDPQRRGIGKAPALVDGLAPRGRRPAPRGELVGAAPADVPRRGRAGVGPPRSPA